MPKKSHIEETIFNNIKLSGFPLPEREFRFNPNRRWRFDFAYPENKIAIEAEGGIWSGGRHTRGSGFIKDCQKYNSAVILGWKVLRYTHDNANEVINDLQTILMDCEND